jgi:hypothetical protein
MKITDPQVIEDGEKDLINAVQEDLDLDAVKQILKDRMGASTLSSKGGQIVVHNNEIAFRLDFDINLNGSLLFDREGNYIDDSGEADLLKPAGDPEMALEKLDAGDALADEGIEESLSNGIPLVETGLNETGPDATDPAEPDLSEQDLEDNISIGLPEYDLEDEPEDETKLTDQEETNMSSLDLETGDLLSDKSVETQDPESMAESNVVDTQNLENESLEGNDLADESVLQEEVLDDDINGILKESRDFWEQKKDS